MFHALVKQSKREVSNQCASKCNQNTSIFPGISSDIALLTHCIVLDVNRAGQACDEGDAFHLQRHPCWVCLVTQAYDWVKAVGQANGRALVP